MEVVKERAEEGVCIREDAREPCELLTLISNYYEHGFPSLV